MRRRPSARLVQVPTPDHGFDPLTDVCVFCFKSRMELDNGGPCERIAYQTKPRLTN